MILQTTAQGFWLNDKDDKMMDVNEAMCEILDLPKEEIVGREFFGLPRRGKAGRSFVNRIEYAKRAGKACMKFHYCDPMGRLCLA